MSAEIVQLYPRGSLTDHPPLRSLEDIIAGKLRAGVMTTGGAVLALQTYKGLSFLEACEAVHKVIGEMHHAR